jgi:hypothetical protein
VDDAAGHALCEQVGGELHRGLLECAAATVAPSL